MDLQTMGTKLQNGMYKNRDGFEADFRLMVQNCKTYNPQGSYAYNECVALEGLFDKGTLFIFFHIKVSSSFCMSLL